MLIYNMKKSSLILPLLLLFVFACQEKKDPGVEHVSPKKDDPPAMMHTSMGQDSRKSLHLNPMQKHHQLMNMRSHLEAVHDIINLLAEDRYDEASEVAYKQLGSTTEMKMMCASFGDKNFEQLGLQFHASADKMSEVFKTRDKDKSLRALAHTTNFCIQCHKIYRQ